MKNWTILPAQNNFADLRELADKLINQKGDEAFTRLTAIVGTLLYRCDLLEREVERLGRSVPSPRPKKTVAAKKVRR